MKPKHAAWFCVSLCFFVCAALANDRYVVMDSDLAEFKAGFNTAVDHVRLVFIVGPT